MLTTPPFSAQILDRLYYEAIALSDAVREAFAPQQKNQKHLSRTLSNISFSNHVAEQHGEIEELILSSEGLRTTTRMLHVIAWLLNQRAYLLGEISEQQLRQHGRLSPDTNPHDAECFQTLSPLHRTLVHATQDFYARLKRLDQGWQERKPFSTSESFQRLHALSTL